MKYINLINNKVAEIIPEVDERFPGVPINQRYSPEFLSACIQVPENVEVSIGMVYKDGGFSEPGAPAIPDDLPGTKSAKIAEVNAACSNAIYAGVDVETTQGPEHFSLTENDQINLSAVFQQIQLGAESALYHADGKLCRLFTAAEITGIMTAATQFKTYHTTYVNHLHVWVYRTEEVEAVRNISYGAVLPEDLQANLNSLLGIVS